MNIRAIFAKLRRILTRETPPRATDPPKDGLQSSKMDQPSETSVQDVSPTYVNQSPVIKETIRFRKKQEMIEDRLLGLAPSADEDTTASNPKSPTTSAPSAKKQRTEELIPCAPEALSEAAANQLAERKLLEVTCYACGTKLFFDGELPSPWTKVYGTKQYLCSTSCHMRSTDPLSQAVAPGARVSIEGQYVKPKFNTKWCSKCSRPFDGPGDECGACPERTYGLR